MPTFLTVLSSAWPLVAFGAISYYILEKLFEEQKARAIKARKELLYQAINIGCILDMEGIVVQDSKLNYNCRFLCKEVGVAYLNKSESEAHFFRTVHKPVHYAYSVAEFPGSVEGMDTVGRFIAREALGRPEQTDLIKMLKNVQEECCKLPGQKKIVVFLDESNEEDKMKLVLLDKWNITYLNFIEMARESFGFKFEYMVEERFCAPHPSNTNTYQVVPCAELKARCYRRWILETIGEEELKKTKLEYLPSPELETIAKCNQHNQDNQDYPVHQDDLVKQDHQAIEDNQVLSYQPQAEVSCTPSTYTATDETLSPGHTGDSSPVPCVVPPPSTSFSDDDLVDAVDSVPTVKVVEDEVEEEVAEEAEEEMDEEVDGEAEEEVDEEVDGEAEEEVEVEEEKDEGTEPFSLEALGCIIELEGFTKPNSSADGRMNFLCREVGVTYMFKNDSKAYFLQVDNSHIENLSPEDKKKVEEQVTYRHGLQINNMSNGLPQTDLRELLEDFRLECATQDSSRELAVVLDINDETDKAKLNFLKALNIPYINLAEVVENTFRLIDLAESYSEVNPCGRHDAYRGTDPVHCAMYMTKLYKKWIQEIDFPYGGLRETTIPAGDTSEQESAESATRTESSTACLTETQEFAEFTTGTESSTKSLTETQVSEESATKIASFTTRLAETQESAGFTARPDSFAESLAEIQASAEAVIRIESSVACLPESQESEVPPLPADSTVEPIQVPRKVTTEDMFDLINGVLLEHASGKHKSTVKRFFKKKSPADELRDEISEQIEILVKQRQGKQNKKGLLKKAFGSKKIGVILEIDLASLENYLETENWFSTQVPLSEIDFNKTKNVDVLKMVLCVMKEGLIG